MIFENLEGKQYSEENNLFEKYFQEELRKKNIPENIAYNNTKKLHRGTLKRRSIKEYIEFINKDEYEFNMKVSKIIKLYKGWFNSETRYKNIKLPKIAIIKAFNIAIEKYNNYKIEFKNGEEVYYFYENSITIGSEDGWLGTKEVDNNVWIKAKITNIDNKSKEITIFVHSLNKEKIIKYWDSIQIKKIEE